MSVNGFIFIIKSSLKLWIKIWLKSKRKADWGQRWLCQNNDNGGYVCVKEWDHQAIILIHHIQSFSH